MSTVVIALLLILLSSCGNKNNSTVDTQSEDIQKTNEAVVPTNTNHLRYTQLSTDAIINAINNYYINDYRIHNINCAPNETMYEGQEIHYNVYDAGRNYLLVKFDKYENFEYHYIDSTFRISYDLSIERDGMESEELDKLWNDNSLLLICSGSFYVERNSEITFDNYDGKEELLNEFKHLIWSRYFGDAEDQPMFHESTKAVKVDLLDFDEKTTIFDLLIYTEDEHIYQVSLEYVETDKDDPLYEFCKKQGVPDAKYQFIEQPELYFSVSDVLNYDAESCTNYLLTNLMYLYNFLQDHTICTIDAESEC